jgi:hypothetical protein
LIAVVVFPTPPFWFAIAMIFPMTHLPFSVFSIIRHKRAFAKRVSRETSFFRPHIVSRETLPKGKKWGRIIVGFQA